MKLSCPQIGIVALVAAFVGCEAREVARSQAEARRTYAAVLSFAPEPDVVQLPKPAEPPPYTNLKLRDVALRVPQCLREPEFRHDGGQATLKYDGFQVVVTLMSNDGDELAALGGATEFERVQMVYRFEGQALQQAKTPADVARVKAILAAKALIVTNLAADRFVEFRTPRLRGFIQGSLAEGSSGVHFETFPPAGKRGPWLTFAFAGVQSPLTDGPLSDADLERYVAAIEIVTPSSKP